MEYRGYTIQQGGYGFYVRDRAGKILVEVESVTEAEKWINVEKDGCTEFRELD